MPKGLCAWTFTNAGSCKTVDKDVLRLRKLMEVYGFVFSLHHNLPHIPDEVQNAAREKLNYDPSSLSDEEWKQTGYPFLPIDRDTIIKIYNADYLDINKKTVEAAEAILGDFFALDGAPRHIAPRPD